MTDPRTTLDTRFSDPDTAPTSWADTERVIADAPLFWISTTRADGRPHVTPLVAVWLDGALHFATGATEQKARNLQGVPDVVLTTGDNRWDTGLDVTVEGRARRVTDRPSLERLASAWAGKWDGRWQFVVGDDGFDDGEHGVARVYAVAPSRVLAFGKNPFTHTSHRFDRGQD